MMGARRSQQIVAAAAALLAPLAVQACPQCAGREEGGLALGLLIAGMIALPFVVTSIVVRIIRRAEAERAEPEANALAPQK